MAITTLSLSASSAVWAQASTTSATKSSTSFLGTFGHWQAYSFNEAGQPVCYMVVTKDFPHLKPLKRGAAHLMITHRPSENATDVVSYSPGYLFQPAHDVRITTGVGAFNLFAEKDSAWTRNAHDDHALATAIHTTTNLTILGVPAQKGVPAITDKLDITGAAAAYQAIGKACGLEGSTPKKATKTKKKSGK